MRKFGLIGFPLSHSFSKKYFTEKFENEGIKDAVYDLYELKDLAEFPIILKNNPELIGLNVTIPYKEAIIPYLDELGDSAQEVGAVNVIKIDKNQKTVGFNSDYYGFLQTLEHFLLINQKSKKGLKALVLGTGGAAKAVQAVLKKLEISFLLLSREPKKDSMHLAYESVNEELIREYQLIVNTTPLGMYPKVDAYPPIPYQFLSTQHFLLDLVYNPTETEFLKRGKIHGAKIENGLPMLYQQAEKAWEIWHK